MILVTGMKSLAAVLLSLFLTGRRGWNGPESHVINQHALRYEYDFVIVGGGSAGSVLANRLSENPQWTVLLLEAGGDENELSEVPFLVPYLAQSKMDWGYSTESHGNFCLGLDGKRCPWTSGKGLGGSSSIGHMIHVRGSNQDFDSWEEMGNKGWSSKKIQAFFQKSENRETSTRQGRRYPNCTDGPLTVSEIPFLTPLAAAFLQGGEDLGYGVWYDEEEIRQGFTIPQANILRGSRSSVSKAYLRPVGSRRNLHVAKEALVEKLVLDESGKAVKSVLFRRRWTRHKVHARKEVILSAGALRSPQLLMLSGVGPIEHLRSSGVNPVVDLPGVGQNLQDHISVGGLVFLVDSPVSALFDRYITLENFQLWTRKGQGPLASPGGVEGLAWVNSKSEDFNSSTIEGNRPNIQLRFTSASILSDKGRLRLTHGLSDEIWRSVYQDSLGKDSWSIRPMLLRPKSRGWVSLRSCDPKQFPLFFPNYLDQQEDVDVLLEGIRISMELSNTTLFRDYNSRLIPNPLPQCQQHDFLSDEYWECHLRHYTISEHHYAGTCKMGPASDHMSVVDSSLKVHGLNNLRVVDASVMPELTSGDPNAAVVMISEKAAHIIQDEWKEKEKPTWTGSDSRNSGIPRYNFPWLSPWRLEQEATPPPSFHNPWIFLKLPTPRPRWPRG